MPSNPENLESPPASEDAARAPAAGLSSATPASGAASAKDSSPLPDLPDKSKGMAHHAWDEMSAQERRLEELHKKSGGRRISDRIKPLFSHLISVIASDNIAEAFLNFSDEVRDFFECEQIIIYSVQRGRGGLVSRNLVSDQVEEKRAPLSQGNLPGYAFLTGRTLNIADAYNPKDLARYPGLKHDPALDEVVGYATRQALVAPVFFEDKAVGVLEILNHAHNQVFSNQLVKLAQELAPAVGSVLAKLREEEKREILHEAGLIVQQVGNLGGQLVKLNELLVDLFDGDGATIFSVDEERQEIFTRIKTEEGVQELRFPIGLKSIVGWVAQEKYMINLADVYDPDNRARYHPDLCFDESWDRIAGKRTHAMLCCPLINQEKVLGVVQVVNRLDKEGFDHLCERNMVTLSQILAPAFGMKVKPVEWKPTKFSYLLDHGYLTQEELEAALAVAREQNAALEKILLEEKRVASGVLGKSYEAFFGVPYLGYKETVLVPPRNFNGLNPSHLRRQHWVPLEREESRVVVLVDDPGNEEKIQEIRNVFQGQEVKFKVGLRSDIDQYLTAALPKERLGPEDGAAADTEPSPEPVDSPPGAAGVVTPDNPAVVHQVHQILSRALEQGAADIHFEPQPAGDLQVRLRRESGCEVIDTVSSTHHWAVVNRLKVLSKIDPAAACLPQEGRVTLRFGDRDVTLWTVILPTLGGVEDVVVHISQAESPRPLAEMGLSRRDETVVLEALAKPQGLALVGGPPGPGKNALLHSLLARLNTPGRKLWTAEHPVEIVHPGVRQMPMNPRGGLDCARALDAIMLGDPDVVLIGDIPDRETGAMVLQASLGGTLVLGSLNAPGTCQTVVRCLELGLDPARLAEALTVVLAQRFGKALCPSCKESYRPGQEEYDALVREYGEQEWSGLGVKGPSKLRLHRGRGCPQCWDTGYAGRVGLYEVLQITPAMKGLIREGAGREELRLQALADGMTTMKQDGIGKVIAGECDFQQVAAVGL